MSDIGSIFGPFDITILALIVSAPGLVPGAAAGALAWRRHQLYGALLGANAVLALWVAGFVFWKTSPWN